MISIESIRQAANRIAPHIKPTPLTRDVRRNAWFKWENQQVTGSFKVRGALNKILSLEEQERQAGLVAASAGNHGQGVAFAAKLTGAQAKVFSSDHAVPTKLNAMRALGAAVELMAGSYEQIEQTAMAYAKAGQKTWISPYNDMQIIAGQGTIGLELDQVLHSDRALTIVVPVGGGGLISGIGAAIKDLPLRPKLIGVNPSASAFMHSIVKRGTQENVPDLPTLADGLSGAVEQGSLTIAMVNELVDDMITVDEESIARAIATAWHEHGEVIEGSGAVGLAALLEGRIKSPALILISGGNIQPETHHEICARYGAVQ